MADFKKAKSEAEKIWDEMYLSSPPIPILEVAETFGLSVQEVEFSERDDISGILDLEQNTIYVNQRDSPEHKRFTIAHELGHFILHRDKSVVDIYYRRPIGGETEDVEKEANCFAANLLVPMKIFEKVCSNFSDTDLAKMFAVSQQVIGYRKKLLNNAEIA